MYELYDLKGEAMVRRFVESGGDKQGREEGMELLSPSSCRRSKKGWSQILWEVQCKRARAKITSCNKAGIWWDVVCNWSAQSRRLAQRTSRGPF